MPASLALRAELCGVLSPLQKGYLFIQNTSPFCGERTLFRDLKVIFRILKSEKGSCHSYIHISFLESVLTEANTSIGTQKYKTTVDD